MIKSMFKIYDSTCKGIFFRHTALHFFDVAAGYIEKMCLVCLKNLLFSVRITKFKPAQLNIENTICSNF